MSRLERIHSARVIEQKERGKVVQNVEQYWYRGIPADYSYHTIYDSGNKHRKIIIKLLKCKCLHMDKHEQNGCRDDSNNLQLLFF